MSRPQDHRQFRACDKSHQLFGIYSARDDALCGTARWELFEGGEAEVSIVGTLEELKEWEKVLPDGVMIGEVVECVRYAPMTVDVKH